MGSYTETVKAPHSMMRVLIVTGTMNAGGAEAFIMEMLRHAGSDIQYYMLIHTEGTPPKGVYDDEIKALGIPIVYIHSVRRLGIKRYIREFNEKIRIIGKVDAVHSHLNGIGGVIAKAAKRAGIRIRIVHCHANITYTGNMISVLMNEALLFVYKRYIQKYGTALWACSASAGMRLFGNKRQVLVIPNFVDSKKYLSSESKRRAAKEKYGVSSKCVIGSVGRIAPIKNYEFVLDILVKLRETGLDTVFVCFGRVADAPYYECLLKRATQLGIEKYTRFLGHSSSIADDLALFDVFLMPSRSEGFGIAAIEAQAAGLPTLVSEGVPKLIDAGLGLIRFLPYKAEKWAEAVFEMISAARPSDSEIISAFDKKGFNSTTAVTRIESEYLKLNQNEGAEAVD